MITELFSDTNETRATIWHPDFRVVESPSHWNGADWANAMQGEAGEAGNVVKKLRRMETGIQQAEGKDEGHNYYNTLVDKLADEIADTYTYLDLLASYYRIEIGPAIIRKFNAISRREGFKERADHEGRLTIARRG